MQKDPLAREREFREKIERAVRDKHDARVRRAGVVPRVLGRVLGRVLLLLLILGFPGLFVYVFGFYVKGTAAYACSLAEARRSPVVIAQLGEPVEAGLFAWTSGYSQEGSVTDASFRTSLTGPKGSGTLRTRWYVSPVGSSMRLELEKDGQTHAVYGGAVPCR